MIDLADQPLFACFDFPLGRFLMDTPLAARLILEMLHGVCHVDLPTIDARIGKRAVQDLASRAHEGPPFEILAVTRLLADQHHERALASLPKDCLSRVLP